ncbi:hypothetical protein Tco_1275130 [Tanacetum coccineum]
MRNISLLLSTNRLIIASDHPHDNLEQTPRVASHDHRLRTRVMLLCPTPQPRTLPPDISPAPFYETVPRLANRINSNTVPATTRTKSIVCHESPPEWVHLACPAVTRATTYNMVNGTVNRTGRPTDGPTTRTTVDTDQTVADPPSGGVGEEGGTTGQRGGSPPGHRSPWLNSQSTGGSWSGLAGDSRVSGRVKIRRRVWVRHVASHVGADRRVS